MALHPGVKYLHIGCDEVFQIGECDVCRLEMHETLFLKHVKTVADIIHGKFPSLRIIIWDDMLRHLPQQNIMDFNLGELVEPMVCICTYVCSVKVCLLPSSSSCVIDDVLLDWFA